MAATQPYHAQAVIHRDLKPANLMLGGPKIYNSFHKQLCYVGVLGGCCLGLDVCAIQWTELIVHRVVLGCLGWPELWLGSFDASRQLGGGCRRLYGATADGQSHLCDGLHGPAGSPSCCSLLLPPFFLALRSPSWVPSRLLVSAVHIPVGRS